MKNPAPVAGGASRNGRYSMNLTIRFANPFYLATFSAAALFLGWAIGARWGHSVNAGLALLWAIILLVIHDMAMAVMVGISGYRFAQHLRKKERG
jgi:hypothetical protein